MDKKISQLNSITTPSDLDLLAIVNDGETKNINVSNFVSYVSTGLEGKGFGRYDDTQWTSSNPFPLLNGVTVKMPNNAGNVVSKGSFVLYDERDLKVRGEEIDATYAITIVFKAKAPNTNNTHLEVDFYSPSGDYNRLSQPVIFYKGNDTEQNEHLMAQYYTDADFVNNGIEVRITSVGGNAEIYDIIYFIQRIQ